MLRTRNPTRRNSEAEQSSLLTRIEVSRFRPGGSAQPLPVVLTTGLGSLIFPEARRVGTTRAMCRRSEAVNLLKGRVCTMAFQAVGTQLADYTRASNG